jgi:hypothetical protein
MALDTGNTTSSGPEIPAGIADPLANGVNYGIDVPPYIRITSQDSIYTGSLSAHGSIVAMTLNTGNYQVLRIGVEDGSNNAYTYIPWLTGYLREYWKNPKFCTFGANSAIPAITGVMPARFAETPGNALYYIDLQITRLTGSNYFDNYSFINNFNQILGWLTNANNYLLAVNNSEKRNLKYFGVKSYQEFLSQGFNRYAEGLALKTAIANIGTLIQQIPSGRFGTSNSVAKHFVDNGLGAIGDLSLKIQAAGINFADILDPIYTNQLDVILQSINNIADLSTIQTVIRSTVPNLRNALDFTSISVAGGRPNDSVFTTFSEFGKDLFQKTPNFSIATGKELADLIDTVLNQATQNVENLATKSSLLPEDIIESFKNFLPKTPDGGPASILDVIGCASGYLLEYLNEVNQGLDILNKSAYGTQIHSALTQIMDSYKTYNSALINSWIEVGNASAGDVGFVQFPIDQALVQNYEQNIQNYFNLLNQLSNDPAYKNIVQTINLNWDLLCEGINTEVVNYNKANMTVSNFQDNTVIYSFISSLPSYALDNSGLGTDYFLYGMCQPNQAGDIVKSILNQYKNTEILANAGVQIRGTV